MAQPIVFISTHRIKEGKLDALRESYQKGAAFMEANKPDTVAFLAYVNEEGTEVSTVHVFPDAEAMERHMEGVGERAKEAADYLDFELFEVYGRPSDKVLRMMEQTEGVTLRIRPEHVSGYIRHESV